MMKHVSITAATLSLLSILLVILAVIQYRWLGQLSEGELARMRANLRVGASRFADDFDKEITQLYSAFQARYPDDTAPAAAFLSSCYKQWNHSSLYPQLLKNVYYATYSDRSLELFQWVPESDSLKSIPWDPKFQSIRKRFDHQKHVSERDSTKTNRIFIFHGPVLDDFPFVILTLNPVAKFVQLPLRASISEFVILEMNEEYLRSQLIPMLLAHHFPEEGNDAYHLTIVNPTTQHIFYSNDSVTTFTEVEFSDIVNPIARIRMQDFFMVTVKDRTDNFQLKGVTKVATSIEINDSKSTAIRREISDWQDTADADSLSRWELRIKHRSGSLEAAVAHIRLKNLAISSGILLVLGASLIILVVSLRREQFLARQRMEFVAGVTHELRTPLAVLKSAGENLADGVVKSEEQITLYGKLVRDQGTFLSEMVEQVLDYAGIESGKKLLKKETIVLQELLNELQDDMAEQFSKKNISVTIVPCDGIQIIGDYYALKSAFHNILSNAVKYSTPNSGITVSIVEDARNIVIAVKDRGIGIDPKELPLVFEPFYRTQKVRDSQIHGNGLGLSIVKKIVEQHGGHVTVDSLVNQGTTVTIYLPKVK